MVLWDFPFKGVAINLKGGVRNPRAGKRSRQRKHIIHFAGFRVVLSE